MLGHATIAGHVQQAVLQSVIGKQLTGHQMLSQTADEHATIDGHVEQAVLQSVVGKHCT